MEDVTTVDVLIVGAGPAGLTMAIDLARRNVSFRLVDRNAHPFAGSRGKGIQARSQEVLEDLGVLDRIVAIGGRYPLQRDYDGVGTFTDGAVTDPISSSPAEPYQAPLLVPQFLTEQVLRERLVELGGRVEHGSELIDLDQETEGVMASLATPSGVLVIRARYLVGADGARSFVRRALGIDFPGKTLGVRAVVADVAIENLDRDVWHTWNSGSMERQISLCPLPGTKLFQLQAPIPFDGEADLSAMGLSRMILDRTCRVDIAIRSVSWASAYTMNARLADRYRDLDVFLVGDAAHAHPPTGGQGLNTSLQDAYNLSWKLAAVIRGADATLLDSYEAERRPVAEQMLGLTTRLLEDAKAGRSRRGRDVAQLDIGYNGSALAIERPKRAGPLHAGDRAPDASLTSAAGQRVRVFDLIRGPHWTAMGYRTTRASAPCARKNLHVHRISSDGDMQDATGEFKDAYDVSDGSWILVRPDGYIGAIVAATETDAMADYLEQVGMPAFASA